MAWMIQSNAEGPVIIADIGLTFTARQIKNVDLIGRNNAEQSNDLKLMLLKGFLKEIKKDASEETVDPKFIQQMQQQITQAQNIVQTQSEMIGTLETQNQELKKQNVELHEKMDRVLDEVKSFADKFPLQIRTIAEAMRNIEGERAVIARERSELPQSGESEAEIKTHDKILAMKEKKLEKNVKNLGSTISESANDYKDALDALDELNI